PGEAGDGEAAGAIAGAHGVLVLAPAHGLGVGVEGETEAGGDVGRRLERDLAARRRDGLGADAADGGAQPWPPGPVRRAASYRTRRAEARRRPAPDRS